ncbi:hypothetical protein [Streptomyces shaanxiensis]|uniref:hypothetical protein n=1 Tax=Streptomyces shaanxiensis TaxID=653357 RepID=UPI0031EE8C19
MWWYGTRSHRSTRRAGTPRACNCNGTRPACTRPAADASRPGTPFDELTLPDGARLTARHDPDLLGGMSVVSADGLRRGAAAAVRPTAVPYYAWANRPAGPLRVWIPRV